MMIPPPPPARWAVAVPGLPLKFSGGDQVFGVIGNPIAHSLSPAIFNALFESQQINAVYVPILLEGGFPEFAAFLDGLLTRQESHGLDFHGFSVTIPHKSNALEYLLRQGGSVEPLASRIGAVNTLKLGFGELPSGYNTDYAGAIDALVHALGTNWRVLHGKSVAVSGGAARPCCRPVRCLGKGDDFQPYRKSPCPCREFPCAYCGLDSSVKLPPMSLSTVPVSVCTRMSTLHPVPDNFRPGGGL
jgi:hypothetical protein